MTIDPIKPVPEPIVPEPSPEPIPVPVPDPLAALNERINDVLNKVESTVEERVNEELEKVKGHNKKLEGQLHDKTIKMEEMSGTLSSLKGAAERNAADALSAETTKALVKAGVPPQLHEGIIATWIVNYDIKRDPFTGATTLAAGAKDAEGVDVRTSFDEFIPVWVEEKGKDLIPAPTYEGSNPFGGGGLSNQDPGVVPPEGESTADMHRRLLQKAGQ